MKTSVLILGLLAAIGCGSVTAKSPDDDGGTGGATGTGGKDGIDPASGGQAGAASSTGGIGPATGGSGGGSPGTGGAQASGGVGGAVTGAGGVPATGGVGAAGSPGTGGVACGVSLTLCNGGCVDLLADGTSCGSCGHECTPGQSCTNGICAESCTSLGWTPSGCTSCAAGTKTGKACSVCTNEPSWFTGSTVCQDGDASGFVVTASCAACSAL